MSLKRFLAVLILATAGCDKPESAKTAERDAPPAQASRQELAELESALAVSRTNAVPCSAAPAQKSAEDVCRKQPVAEPAATGFGHDEGRIRLQFNGMPDLQSLRSYLRIEPDPGPLVQNWLSWSKTLQLKGDFSPRTSYRLTLRAGCPMADGRATVSEFRRAWTTGDRAKDIAFASEGRYLPSAGLRAVSLRTMNVTNLFCQIRTVPSRNIVQLLAREENRYNRYYGGGGDSSDTEELAAEPVSRPLRVRVRLNEECVTTLPIRDDDGRAANGVYLVSARDGDRDAGPTVWRLICVTDIGLSVREANGTVYVWATSLTTGRPVPDLRVMVYGANNVMMAEGLTDAEGWCSCEMPDAGTPLAVVAERMDGGDTSFLAMSGALDESVPEGGRRPYVKGDGSEAFVWTDRGIYRHDERILVHALLRNGAGNAPRPFPVTVGLVDSEGREVLSRTLVSDAFGSVSCDTFSVAAEQKSGWWEVRVRTPGDNGFLLGSRRIKIEEFVPPQIRVKVTPPAAGGRATTNMMFTVAGEHLFGGPAKGLPAEAAVMFEDAPFAPKGWEAFRFGDENRRLQPNFTKLDVTQLGADGTARFIADFPASAHPRAAVRMTLQGSVFESGGRPASARVQTELHAHPFYIGVQLPETLREAAKPRDCRVVLVNPDGTPHRGEIRLTARFERIERVFGLRKVDGAWEWRSEQVRHPLGEASELVVPRSGMAKLKVPVSVCGDCAVTLLDEASGVSFGASYWVSGGEDAAVRTALENPSRVTLKADRSVYYPGERPRITVKAPFAGSAWLNILRDEMVYSQVFTLTNATSEIVLEPVTAKWAPGVDIMLSVVQAAGGRFVSNRAFGVLPLRAATRDSALTVKVDAKVRCTPTGGSDVEAVVDARGEEAVGERAVVTVVDEGIHILTDEKVPDPVGWFGAPRDADHPLYDIYYRLLPILEDPLRRAGAKTGGGAEGDLFRRVSPMPTRRFRPLSIWKQDVELKGGRAVIPFKLPEFVGEIRVTAVAYGHRATGAGAVRSKVAPNLVMQPDAPRFAAPGDTFLATVTLSNRSGRDGVATYDLMAGGPLSLERPVHGEVRLSDGASETLTIPVRVGRVPGQGTLVFVSEGLGEKHASTIELPVRPAVAWNGRNETFCLKPGEKMSFPNPGGDLPETARRKFLLSANPVAELASALEQLIGYPYGCLEQTVSRVFPLVAAGGLLNTLPVSDTSAAQDSRLSVDDGIRRVCAMMHANDFSAWPDGDTPPWNREVSLWAAHFLLEAAKAGFAVPPDRIVRTKGYLRRWAMSTNETVSVYACHSLALAGVPDQDRMLHWFDGRTRLSALSRARLSRAFAFSGDRDRACALLDSVSPATVKEAAFALLAHLDLDPAHASVPGLVSFLLSRRAAGLGHWETTESNAHALLALGSFYRMHPSPAEPPELTIFHDGREQTLQPKRPLSFLGGSSIDVSNRGRSTAYLSMASLTLPAPETVVAESRGISVRRRFLRTDGQVADLSSLVRGEMLVAEVTLSAPAPASFTDLVVEELLPACFEPDQTRITPANYAWVGKLDTSWELRRELRDDRVLGFAHPIDLGPEKSVRFLYAVRIVSAGDFVLPGSSVEAMYAPGIRARGVPSRIRVEK